MPLLPKKKSPLVRQVISHGDGILARIQPLGECGPASYLFYGQSGSGKTTLWSTFPGPTLAILCSAGSRPNELRSIPRAGGQHIHQIALQEADELSAITEYAQGGDYKTVVLDHVTAFQDKVLTSILGLQELPEQKSWGMVTQQQYGACTLRCKELLRQLINLPCNVVIIAQERVIEPSEDSVLALIPPHVNAGVSPSLATWLNYACDYVGQTFIRAKVETYQTKVGEGKNAKVVEKRRQTDEPEFCLRVRQHQVYKAKFRVPGGIKVDHLVNPTYAKIMDLIEGKEGG